MYRPFDNRSTVSAKKSLNVKSTSKTDAKNPVKNSTPQMP